MDTTDSPKHWHVGYFVPRVQDSMKLNALRAAGNLPPCVWSMPMPATHGRALIRVACRPFAIAYATKFELSRGCVEGKDRHSDGLQYSELGGVNAAEAVLSLGGGEGRDTARKGSAQGFIFKFFLNSSIKRNHPCVDR